MIDEDRLRRQMQQAIGYEPPSPLFGMQPISSVAAAQAVGLATESKPRQSFAMALVAALLALAVIITILFASRVLHPPQTVPVHPPGASTSYHSWCNAESTTCAVFITSSTGWLAVNAGSTGAVGPISLYKTVDGGGTWQRQLTWDCPAAYQMVFSPDGRQGLVVAYTEAVTAGGVYNSGRCDAPIFHTVDGGAHWQRLQLAPAAEQAIRACGGACDLYHPITVSFINTDDGWVLSREYEFNPTGVGRLTSSFSDLYRTTDGGATWSLVTRLSTSPDTSGPVANSKSVLPDQNGELAFVDGTTGYLLPDGSSSTGTVALVLYVTHDSGANWQKVQIALPPGPHVDSEYWVVPYGKSQVASGALEVFAPSAGLGYVYTKSKVGDHWSLQAELPGALQSQVVDVVDADHWVAWSADRSGLMSTVDGGKHWVHISAASPMSPPGFNSINFDDSTHGFGWTTACLFEVAPANGGAVPPPPSIRSCLATTSDSGASWTPIRLPAT